MELIILMHFLGMVNVEHQKFDIPEMTVLISSKRPAIDSDLALQQFTFFFTCWISGSQLARDSFLVHRGTPRYLTGRIPWVNPVSDIILLISGPGTPQEKKQVLEMLTARPETSANWFRISRIFFTATA